LLARRMPTTVKPRSSSPREGGAKAAMSTTEDRSSDASGMASVESVDMKLEVVNGPDPERGSYRSWLSFSDPDGMVAEQAGTELPT
jgi:hypothetical protein